MTFKQNKSNGVVWMTSPLIHAKHAFTTRYGGVSSGIWESLNLGESRGDSKDAVRENFRRICVECGFPDDKLVFSKQVHGTEIRAVTSADAHELFTDIPYEADGLMTDERGLVLSIFTADCVPVLLHDPVRGAVAAVHAGWRGTVEDIAGIAVLQMGAAYGCRPENICAAIGPSIGKCCFETGDDVADAARALLGAAAADRFIILKNGRQTVDLRGMNRYLLERVGVSPKSIASSGECTMCRHKKYWSHRYTKGERGSMASFIML